MTGPKEPGSQALHSMKYRQKGETFEEAMRRVARATADDKAHEDAIFEMTCDQSWLFAGRIQNAMGATKKMTALNCFVSGTIEDDSHTIGRKVNEAFLTMRHGGGIGFDFSRIRPRGDLITSLESEASGPVPFMGWYNGMGNCVSTAGHRRGAMMAILRVDHPDIEEYVKAKQDQHSLTAFNTSIAVTDEFMQAVVHKLHFHLMFNGEVRKTVYAPDLWEKIMESTWDWAEPGVVFIDRINEMNNLYYCETIAATNPCGEQPLPPYGACLLGSVNLAKLLVRTSTAGSSSRYMFDYVKLAWMIPHIVRAMDNIVDRALYPLEEQRDEMQTKRRLGIGVTGAANAGEALGFPYGSDEFVRWIEGVQEFIAVRCYLASAHLAQERGPFPLYDERYLFSNFIKKLPHDIQSTIARHGIRNSHLTSVAPTGTISFCADNPSSGIEPVFSYSYDRPIFTPEGKKTFHVEDYGVKYLGIRGLMANQVSAERHVRVLAAVQRWVDSAVSKTCNVDGSMPFDHFKNLYMAAWKMGCKGCTTFNQDGKRMALLTAKPAEPTSQVKSQPEDFLEGEGCRFDPSTGRRECA